MAARSGREPETTRSTSAPRSASVIVAYGPGNSVVKSRIFNPFNGPAISFSSFQLVFPIYRVVRQGVFGSGILEIF